MRGKQQPEPLRSGEAIESLGKFGHLAVGEVDIGLRLTLGEDAVVVHETHIEGVELLNQGAPVESLSQRLVVVLEDGVEDLYSVLSFGFIRAKGLEDHGISRALLGLAEYWVKQESCLSDFIASELNPSKVGVIDEGLDLG